MKQTLIECGCPTYDVWPFENNFDTNGEYRQALVTATTIYSMYILAGFKDITTEILNRPDAELFRPSFRSDPEDNLDQNTLNEYPIILTIDKLPRFMHYIKIGCFVHQIYVLSWNYHLELYESSNPYNKTEDPDMYEFWNKNKKITYSEQYYGYTSRLYHLDGTLIYDGLRFDWFIPYWMGDRPHSLAGKYCSNMYEEGSIIMFNNGFDLLNPSDWHEHERFSLLYDQIIEPEKVKTIKDLPIDNIEVDAIMQVQKNSEGKKDKGYYKWDGSKWNKLEPKENEDFNKHYYLLSFNSENDWNTCPVLLYGTEDEYLDTVTYNTRTPVRRRFLGHDTSKVWTNQFDLMYDKDPTKSRTIHSIIGDEFLKDDTVFSLYEQKRFDARFFNSYRRYTISGISGYFYDYSNVITRYNNADAAVPYIGDRNKVPERGFFGIIMPLQLKAINDDDRILFGDIYFGLTNISLKDLYHNRLITIDDGLFFYVGGALPVRPDGQTYENSEEPSYPGRLCLFIYLGDVPEEEIEPDPTQPEPPKEVNKSDVVNLLNNLYDWQLAGQLDTLGSITIPDSSWELIKIVGLFDDLNIFKVLDRDDILKGGTYSICGWLNDTEYNMEFNASIDSVQLTKCKQMNLLKSGTDKEFPYLICYNTNNNSGISYDNTNYYLNCGLHRLNSNISVVYSSGMNHGDLKIVPGDRYRIKIFASAFKNKNAVLIKKPDGYYDYEWCLVDECIFTIPSNSSSYNKIIPDQIGSGSNYIDGGNFIDYIRISQIYTSSSGYDFSTPYLDFIRIYVKRTIITTYEDHNYYRNGTAPFRIELYKEEDAPNYIGTEEIDASVNWSVYYINPYLIEEEE